MLPTQQFGPPNQRARHLDTIRSQMKPGMSNIQFAIPWISKHPVGYVNINRQWFQPIGPSISLFHCHLFWAFDVGEILSLGQDTLNPLLPRRVKIPSITSYVDKHVNLQMVDTSGAENSSPCISRRGPWQCAA